jgi:hypothetical protein
VVVHHCQHIRRGQVFIPIQVFITEYTVDIGVAFNYCKLSEIDWSTLYKVVNGWKMEKRSLKNGIRRNGEWKRKMENGKNPEEGEWKMVKEKWKMEIMK